MNEDREAGGDERLLRVELSERSLRRVVEAATAKCGLAFHIGKDSKAEIHVHIGSLLKEEHKHIGDKVDGHAKVITGVKATGPGATSSTGDIHQTLTGAEATQLADCLERLKSLVGELDLPDGGPLEDAQTSLDEAIDAARSSSPSSEEAKGLWQKVIARIDRAVYVGSIGIELAEKIRVLYNRIHSLLS